MFLRCPITMLIIRDRHVGKWASVQSCRFWMKLSVEIHTPLTIKAALMDIWPPGGRKTPTFHSSLWFCEFASSVFSGVLLLVLQDLVSSPGVACWEQPRVVATMMRSPCFHLWTDVVHRTATAAIVDPSFVVCSLCHLLPLAGRLCLNKWNRCNVLFSWRSRQPIDSQDSLPGELWLAQLNPSFLSTWLASSFFGFGVFCASISDPVHSSAVNLNNFICNIFSSKTRL